LNYTYNLKCLTNEVTDVAQWWSTCLECMRPCIQSLAKTNKQKTKKERKENLTRQEGYNI
jgi:hypothetical protein